MLATDYAEWHGIAPQGENETDGAFRDRVSGELRNAGNTIEAHEVARERRWDAEDGGDTVQTGIMGAMVMAMQGKDYGSTGSSLVGDEIAAGVVASAPKKTDNDLAMMMLAMLMSDRR